MAKQERNKGAPKKRSSKPSTKRHLDLREIREGSVVMKDGTLRAIIAVSSINFALKSDDEQQAIVGQYVQFLNALDYPLQIVIHSRKLDIAPYIAKLGEREAAETNELLKVQMADYRSFVTELVSLGDIMTKSFYVVVPYSAYADERKKFFSRLQEALSPARLVQLKEDKFQERRQALMQRVSHAQSALQSLGLASVILDTQALIELFYRLYNPISAQNAPLVDVSQLQVE
ncbi:MAG: hypothetical protein ABIG71_02245 [Candidatus Uhrbacteria bacterium]